MRLLKQNISFEDARLLIRKAIDYGITSFHSSFEYESYKYFKAIFCDVKKDFPNKKFEHIIKLGEPHFDSNTFNPKRFRKIVEDQIYQLKTERIDVVQWLLRHTPNEDKFRLQILEDCFEEFNLISSKLKKEGKIGIVGCYPYSQKFASEINNKKKPDCWITYFNLIQRNWKDLTSDCFLAISPFAEGVLLRSNYLSDILSKNSFMKNKTIIESSLLFPLLNPNIKTLIGSVSNLSQLLDCVNAINKSYVDQEEFEKVCYFLENNGSRIRIN